MKSLLDPNPWKLNFKTTPEEEKPRNFLLIPDLEVNATNAENPDILPENAAMTDKVFHF